jgi:hypothetical protein
MAKPKPRTAARITVDDWIVQAVQQALRPFAAMLREMGPELDALRAAWRPQLDAWARHPWPTWQASYFTADLAPEVAALRDRLDGVEDQITSWRTSVETMSPRLAWRHGTYLFRQAVGIRHLPVTLLLDCHRLRDAVAHAERTVASYGPITPSPRKVEMALDPSKLRPRQSTPSRVEFDPYRVGGGSAR